eukprot:scaffold5501_cov142-Skeletonema_marinoi.AAC.6
MKKARYTKRKDRQSSALLLDLDMISIWTHDMWQCCFPDRTPSQRYVDEPQEEPCFAAGEVVALGHILVSCEPRLSSAQLDGWCWCDHGNLWRTIIKDAIRMPVAVKIEQSSAGRVSIYIMTPLKTTELMQMLMDCCCCSMAE